MRDYRDAKAMAQSLRQALSDKSFTVTHSESLELVAKTFGLDNWNILAAKLEAAPRPALQSAEPPSPPDKTTLYCSFCGKSQHVVQKLIAGPTVFICDECVGLCDDIIAEGKAGTLENLLAEARARRPDAPLGEATADAIQTFATSQLEAALTRCSSRLKRARGEVEQAELRERVSLLEQLLAERPATATEI